MGILNIYLLFPFLKKNQEANTEDLIIALRGAAKYGLWHKPDYADMVIIHLKELK